jgi:hypothetical protein
VSVVPPGWWGRPVQPRGDEAAAIGVCCCVAPLQRIVLGWSGWKRTPFLLQSWALSVTFSFASLPWRGYSLDSWGVELQPVGTDAALPFSGHSLCRWLPPHHARPVWALYAFTQTAIRQKFVSFNISWDFWRDIQIKVKVTLKLTVSWPVSLGVKPHLGPKTRFMLLSGSCSFVDVWCTLWQGDNLSFISHIFSSTSSIFTILHVLILHCSAGPCYIASERIAQKTQFPPFLHCCLTC